MTLKNLLRTGQLLTHEIDRPEVRRMLAAASRNLHDAGCTDVSQETRLDAAYRAIMQCAMVALWANGFRPDKRAPGHHLTMIQALRKSIGLEQPQIALLDAFRIKRNAIDYTGEGVDTVSVGECIEAGLELLENLESWLRSNRPELV